MEIINRRSAMMRMRNAVANKEVRLGFIGGSITEAISERNWPEIVRGWFTARYPEVRLTMENAAIGGNTSVSGAMRAERELVKPDCDAVFVEFAVNDLILPEDTRNRAREGLVRKLLSEKRDVVIVYTFCQLMYPQMSEGKIPDTIAQFERIAEHYNVSSVWSGKYAYDAVKRGELTWEEWLPVSGGSIHPELFGSSYYAAPVLQLLGSEIAGSDGKAAAYGDGLPAPLFTGHFGFPREIPFDGMRRDGPWVTVRDTVSPWYRYALTGAADGAGLSFPFTGSALGVMLSFGIRSAAIDYRIDGGEKQTFIGDRSEWVPDKGWAMAFLLADGLPQGEHTFEMRIRHGNKTGLIPCQKGTECKILSFVSFADKE